MWMLKSSEQDLEEADVMLGRQLGRPKVGRGEDGGGGPIQLQYKLGITE